MGYKRRFCTIIGGFLFTCLLGLEIEASDRLKLKADSLFYRESTKEMIASSNALLTYKSFIVEAPYLTVGTESKLLTGKGPVFITLEDQDIRADSFSMNLRASIGEKFLS